MNQLTMSDIQFNFSNVTIALQIGNDGKAQLTFTPTQTTELYANTVQHNSEPAVHAAPSSTTGSDNGNGTAVPHAPAGNTVDAPVSAVAAPAAPAAPVVDSAPAAQVTLTPPPAAAPAAPAAPAVPQAPVIPAQQVVHTPAAPAAPAEAAANFLSGNTAIPAQPSAESVAQLVQQSAAIVQGAN